MLASTMPSVRKVYVKHKLPRIIHKFLEDRDMNYQEKMTEREQEFVRTESDFINGGLYNYAAVAAAMGRDHRYLQQERFKLMLEYLHVLATWERKGWYDPRNEWACKCARTAIEALQKADLVYYPEYDEQKFEEMLMAA
jgi:hypothetical protein